jgi:hypothetical protein
MAWLKKKSDPINDRARALTAEIAALEEQIKRLDSRLQQNHSAPRLRSTAVPRGMTIRRTLEPEPCASPEKTETEASGDPIFEKVEQSRLNGGGAEPLTTPDHFNELGVRKYDLPALLQRMKNHLRGPTTTNPKLVNYLAAGGVQGLRPLRYEKRVARNRVLILAFLLFLAGLGIVVVFVKHH